MAMITILVNVKKATLSQLGIKENYTKIFLAQASQL
jgi:hypothetical protein